MSKKNWEEIRAKLMKKPGVKEAYDKLPDVKKKAKKPKELKGDGKRG